MIRGHRGSQVRRLELRFWRSSGKRPRTFLLLCLRIPISRITESTLHGDPLPGSVRNGGSLTMYLGFDVLVPRQRATIEFKQIRGHDPWLKAGSFQAGVRRLVGHWRWSRGEQGRNQNPRRSSGSTFSMNDQVKALIKTSNFHIHALRHVCRGLTFESTKMIAIGLVTSRPDYCNSLLYGTSNANISKLQQVQNDLARVVFQAARNSSSKPLLKQYTGFQLSRG